MIIASCSNMIWNIPYAISIVIIAPLFFNIVIPIVTLLNYSVIPICTTTICVPGEVAEK